jgi:hypothetical protein
VDRQLRFHQGISIRVSISRLLLHTYLILQLQVTLQQPITLLADPADIAVIQVAFLDGIETPTVETADVDFEQLGIMTRGYWDWGVALQDPNGGVRSTGV